MTQNYKNHVRWSIPYHFTFLPLVLIALGYSIYNFIEQKDLTSGLLAFAFVLLAFLGVIVRVFALTVQNRAAETAERIRYFTLTQKALPANLTMGQILALRFASDGELSDLAERASVQGLSPDEIKRAIVNWRGDYNRV